MAPDKLSQLWQGQHAEQAAQQARLAQQRAKKDADTLQTLELKLRGVSVDPCRTAEASQEDRSKVQQRHAEVLAKELS